MTILVMMGVSGCGKTTIAQLVCHRLGWRLLEGDDLHPPANIAKMHAGTPLTDADRWPWLAAIAAGIDAWRAEGVSGVVTCSALRRAYRDILVGSRADVRIVYLKGAKALIAARLSHRTDHFMPPDLLDSQFATLEEPTPDERPIIVEIGPPAETIAEAVIAKRGAS